MAKCIEKVEKLPSGFVVHILLFIYGQHLKTTLNKILFITLQNEECVWKFKNQICKAEVVYDEKKKCLRNLYTVKHQLFQLEKVFRGRVCGGNARIYIEWAPATFLASAKFESLNSHYSVQFINAFHFTESFGGSAFFFFILFSTHRVPRTWPLQLQIKKKTA